MPRRGGGFRPASLLLASLLALTLGVGSVWGAIVAPADAYPSARLVATEIESGVWVENTGFPAINVLPFAGVLAIGLVCGVFFSRVPAGARGDVSLFLSCAGIGLTLSAWVWPLVQRIAQTITVPSIQPSALWILGIGLTGIFAARLLRRGDRLAPELLLTVMLVAGALLLGPSSVRNAGQGISGLFRMMVPARLIMEPQVKPEPRPCSHLELQKALARAVEALASLR